VSPATVSRILKRLGLNRIAALEPAEPVHRYERAAPGEIIHFDIKKLGKFNRIGHRITGDRTGQSNTRGVDEYRRPFASRLFGNPAGRKTRLLPAFPVQRPAVLFRRHGVKVERVMTDNGSGFRSRRYARTLRRLKIRHLRTRPYTPKTNGKAERFV
jgi:hypothetical protein